MDRASVESLIRFAEQIRPRLRASTDSSAVDEVESRYAELMEALDWLIDERAQHEETLAALSRAAPADFERWREAGRALTPGVAAAYALAE